MRKSLWIMLAVLFVAIAPNAHADSFTYTYTDTFFGISWTTAAIPAVTMQTTIPSTDLTATANTFASAGCVTTSVVLDAAGVGSTETVFAPTPCFAATVTSPDGFSPFDYTNPGTYISPGTGDTLVVAPAVTTPEPSSVALMLLGVGLLFVMRKRIGQRLPQAT